MTDDGSDSTGPSLTRRQVLAATSGSALVGLAGCGEPDPDSCDLNTGWDQDNDTTLGDNDDDEDWQIVADPNNSAPVPRPANVWDGIAFVSPFPDSRWIDNEAGGTPTGSGPVTYAYCFCLPEGVDDPELTLQVQAAQEIVDIQLNGTSLSFTSNTGPMGNEAMEEAKTYDDPGLFEEGENCLRITISHPTDGLLNVVGTLENGTADCDCECDCTPGGGECTLTLSKDTAGEFHYGQQATYTVEVCNDGDSECTGPLTIEDDLPDGISFVSASGNWTGTASGGVVTATNDSYGGLDPGECLTLELVVQVAPADEFPGDPPDEVENCATLFHDGEQVTEDCVTHDITHDTCRLSLAKDTAGEFHYGQQATYTYEVCNEQEEACDGPLTIEDDLPDGISFVSASGNWTASVSGGVVEATNNSYGGLAPGECITMEMTVQVANQGSFPSDPPTEVENCATLFQFGERITEDCVTHSVTPGVECDLSFEKSTTGEFNYGEQHQAGYVYEVCNEGEAECSGELGISDPLPDGISGPVSPGSGMTGGVTGGTFEGSIAYSGLAPGECLTRELLVTVGNTDDFSGDPPHEVTNCAALLENGQAVAEDCVTHPVTSGDDTGNDPCPPVAFDLNSGYDQASGTTLGDGVDDADWAITVDETDPGSVPKQATVVNQSDTPGNWPAPFQDSRWISHAPDASYAPPPNSAFEYEYCFCLREGFSDPELDLQVRADNTIVDIRLNGTSLAFTGDGGFLNDPIAETYTDPDRFQAGENCLTLVLENESGEAGLNVAGTMAADNADCDCTPCAPTLSKDVAGEFHYGQQGTYVFTVCNEGEGECMEPFDIVDDLPDGISFVEAGGAWTGSVSGGEVTVTNDSYGGLAPGDCIEFEMTVGVAPEDEFPGDPPDEVENCATLLQNGDVADEDCAGHDITVDEDPCPPVAFDLNTGYDQDNEIALNQGNDDDDWTITADGTNSGTVPRPATVADSAASPGGSFDDSRWISHSENGGGVSSSDVESFTYEYCFCLREGFENPELFLQAQADDQIADIRLNGTTLPFTGDGSFQDEPIQLSYTDTDGFQAGENCLEIVVEDTQGIFAGLNVTGTMTADNADCDCEPGGEPVCEFFFQKDTAGEFGYGQQATYVFEICSDPDLNDGECTGPITIEDDLPDGISLVSVSGDWTPTVSGGVVEATNDSYGGLNPGDCLTMEMTVEVAGKDEFPGDPPHEIENCADLQHDGGAAGSDCVSHTIK